MAEWASCRLRFPGSGHDGASGALVWVNRSRLAVPHPYVPNADGGSGFCDIYVFAVLAAIFTRVRLVFRHRLASWHWTHDDAASARLFACHVRQLSCIF